MKEKYDSSAILLSRSRWLLINFSCEDLPWGSFFEEAILSCLNDVNYKENSQTISLKKQGKLFTYTQCGQ